MKDESVKVLRLEENENCLLAIGGSCGLLKRLQELNMTNEIVVESIQLCLQLVSEIISCIKCRQAFDLNTFVFEMKKLKNLLTETQKEYIIKNIAENERMNIVKNMTQFIIMMENAI